MILLRETVKKPIRMDFRIGFLVPPLLAGTNFFTQMQGKSPFTSKNESNIMMTAETFKNAHRRMKNGTADHAMEK